jgi:hypothetical protein
MYMFHLQYLHVKYLNLQWTWDSTLQYPHTNFKHTLDMGTNLAIPTFQTKTHIGPRTQPNAILTFQIKHTLDLGSNLAIPTFQN